jgi:hypothetical protein
MLDRADDSQLLLISASDINTTAQESASAAISHNYGEEAKDLASTAGESVKTNTKTVGNAIHASSMTGMVASAVQGATEDREKEEKEASK